MYAQPPFESGLYYILVQTKTRMNKGLERLFEMHFYIYIVGSL